MATQAIKVKHECDHTFILEGQVSSATASTFVDDKKNWPKNIWKGKKVKIFSGKGEGQEVVLSSNTDEIAFLNTSWAIIPDNTSLYRGIVIYNTQYCPKCENSGKFNDWQFLGGKSKLLSGIFKLAQDVETVILTPRGSSIFTTQLGSGIELIFGSDVSDDDELLGFIENNVIEALSFLSQNQSLFFNTLDFNESEIYGQLRDLIVERRFNDPRILDLTVDVISFNREGVPVTSPLNIG